MTTFEIDLEKTGIESRKQFYEETQISHPEMFETKRGLGYQMKQMIFHPIDFFTPEKKLAEELTFTVTESPKEKKVIINVEEKKEKKTEGIGSVEIVTAEDYAKAMEKLKTIINLFVTRSLNVEKNQVIQRELSKLNGETDVPHPVEEKTEIITDKN